MTIKRSLAAGCVMGFLIVQAPAASTGANPLVDGTRKMYTGVRDNVLKSAEEMPESEYGFQPASTVRTFGQMVAHVADGQYEFCSALVPGKEKTPDIEKTKSSKADLLDALKTSFSYCDKVYDSLTDAQAVQTVSFFGKPMARITVLDFNTAHTDEHYGNIATYLRMKGLVPPSSKK